MNVYLVTGNTVSDYYDSGSDWVEAVFDNHANAEDYAKALTALTRRVEIARAYQCKAMVEWIEKNPSPVYNGKHKVQAHMVKAEAWQKQYGDEKERVLEEALGPDDRAAMNASVRRCPEGASYDVEDFEVRS